MPAKNIVKTYAEDAYYHVYNRGVEGRDIFLDDQDYKIFLHFVKRYLTKMPQNEVQPRWRNDVVDKLQLAAYCLMPNHFHLLLKQKTTDGMIIFVRALMNSYVRYFNKKYKRIGGLFQSVYKAVRITEEPYLLHLTRYIHLNPLHLPHKNFATLTNYYCSFGEYLGKRHTSWIHPEEILSMFGSKLIGLSKFSSYRDFVENYQGNSDEVLGDLKLE